MKNLNHSTFNVKCNFKYWAECPQDYACEGEYYITVKDNVLHATGKCDEDDTNDFYIKLENGKYYIKTKRFLNQDRQELTKE